MLSMYLSGMRRYKRSSRFVDRKKMKQTVRASRPGNRGFSFTGEYPEADSYKVLEPQGMRRHYTQPSSEPVIHATVGSSVTNRVPVISKHGVHWGVALALLTLWVMLLSGVLVYAYSNNSGVSKRLSQQTVRMATLTNDTAALQGAIANRSSGVNVRQEAVRLGLVNSQGMEQRYVSVPEAAVFNPSNYGLRLNTASIFGQ